MITEKKVVFTLENDEIKTLTKMIELLKTMDWAFDDCPEFSLNGDYCNTGIISDTITFLNNLYYGRKIEAYLKEES